MTTKASPLPSTVAASVRSLPAAASRDSRRIVAVVGIDRPEASAKRLPSSGRGAVAAGSREPRKTSTSPAAASPTAGRSASRSAPAEQQRREQEDPDRGRRLEEDRRGGGRRLRRQQDQRAGVGKGCRQEIPAEAFARRRQEEDERERRDRRAEPGDWKAVSAVPLIAAPPVEKRAAAAMIDQRLRATVAVIGAMLSSPNPSPCFRCEMASPAAGFRS